MVSGWGLRGALRLLLTTAAVEDTGTQELRIDLYLLGYLSAAAGSWMELHRTKTHPPAFNKAFDAAFVLLQVETDVFGNEGLQDCEKWHI